jgi:hypothetical protein
MDISTMMHGKFNDETPWYSRLSYAFVQNIAFHAGRKFSLGRKISGARGRLEVDAKYPQA